MGKPTLSRRRILRNKQKRTLKKGGGPGVEPVEIIVTTENKEQYIGEEVEVILFNDAREPPADLTDLQEEVQIVQLLNHVGWIDPTVDEDDEYFYGGILRVQYDHPIIDYTEWHPARSLHHDGLAILQIQDTMQEYNQSKGLGGDNPFAYYVRLKHDPKRRKAATKIQTKARSFIKKTRAKKYKAAWGTTEARDIIDMDDVSIHDFLMADTSNIVMEF